MAEITIPVFAISAYFTVEIITDVFIEGDEIFRVLIARVAAGEELLPVGQHQSNVIIVDDDSDVTIMRE